MQRYAITDRTLLPGGDLRPLLHAWIAGGVEWVQLRERDLPERALRALTAELAGLFRGTGTRLLVNGLAPKAALEAGAHGVHLRGEAEVEAVREAKALGCLVSKSCHSLDEVERARGAGADLLLWAPVFEKPVPGKTALAGTGLEALRCACRAAGSRPVFALGGVTVANAAACVEAGAAGVAGIRLFAGSEWRQLVRESP